MASVKKWGIIMVENSKLIVLTWAYLHTYKLKQNHFTKTQSVEINNLFFDVELHDHVSKMIYDVKKKELIIINELGKSKRIKGDIYFWKSVEGKRVYEKC